MDCRKENVGIVHLNRIEDKQPFLLLWKDETSQDGIYNPGYFKVSLGNLFFRRPWDNLHGLLFYLHLHWQMELFYCNQETEKAEVLRTMWYFTNTYSYVLHLKQKHCTAMKIWLPDSSLSLVMRPHAFSNFWDLDFIICIMTTLDPVISIFHQIVQSYDSTILIAGAGHGLLVISGKTSLFRLFSPCKWR